MKCPVCKDVTLLIADKKGVEIDYCPECRGIWLDRGELDKLIEKEESYNKEHFSEHSRKEHHYREDNYNHDHDRDYYYDDKDYKNDKYRHKKRRKESFMGEIFDIFGD